MKDQWSADALKELKLELSMLVSPFGGVQDFSINLDTEIPDEGLNGPVSSTQYLDAAEWNVHAQIDKKNLVSAIMASHIHTNKYKLEPVEWKDWIKTQSDLPRCGPLEFRFYYMPLRSDAEFKKIDFERRRVKEFLRSNQGIKIYRDYFRTKPYGNPDGTGDWLNLGYRRSLNPAASSRPGWPVAPQQVIGAIFISRFDNEGLIDQTNREGLVEEAPFFDLRAFALKIIEWFEARVVSFNQVNKPKETETEKTKESTKKAKKKIDKIKESLIQIKTTESSEKREETIKSIISEISLIEEDLNESEQKVDELEQNFEEEKNTLANLASLGVLTVCFGHETKGYCNRAYLNAQALLESYENGKFMIAPDLDTIFKRQIEILMGSTESIQKFAGFALDNVRRDKRRRSKISISSIAHKVFNTFAQTLEDKQGIRLDTDGVADNLPKIMGFTIDWESIFVNLLTNSIWAFRNFPTPEEGKIIKLTVKEESNKIVIHFSDNGRGLEKGSEDMIFLPNFSTRRNDKGVVEGTGMGLAIVYTFIRDHAGGTIDVKSPGEIGGAEFIITIPFK